MTDCTQTPHDRRRPRARRLIAVCLSTVLAVTGSFAASARADGDPASDVLASQPLFLPQDAGVSANRQAQLSALLHAARHSGFQIHVAVIASPADLGSVTALWRQPQNYARFLAQELSLLYRGPLLVVMPSGYGLDRPATAGATEPSGLAGVPAPGRRLGLATLTAIQRLAAASGHTLPLSKATAPARSAPTDTVSWIVFVIGAAAIVLSWAASVRAQPLRARDPAAATRNAP